MIIILCRNQMTNSSVVYPTRVNPPLNQGPWSKFLGNETRPSPKILSNTRSFFPALKLIQSRASSSTLANSLAPSRPLRHVVALRWRYSRFLRVAVLACREAECFCSILAKSILTRVPIKFNYFPHFIKKKRLKKTTRKIKRDSCDKKKKKNRHEVDTSFSPFIR
jgi:hypothetical protein